MPSWSEITEPHTIESDPPSVQWVDRLIGRGVRMLALRALRHRGTIALIGGGIGWLVRHAAHILHWLP